MHIPKHLLMSYQDSLDDPKRLELAPQVALLDARLDELLRGLDEAASDAGYRTLTVMWEQMERADRAGKMDEAARLYSQIRAGLHQGGRIEATWHAISDVIEQRRRLVESERKRMVESAEMVTLGQALAMLTAMQDAVFQHVQDDHALGQIWNTFERLSGHVPGGKAQAALGGSSAD